MKSFHIQITSGVHNKSVFLWLFKTGIQALNLKQVNVSEGPFNEQEGQLVKAECSNCLIGTSACEVSRLSDEQFVFSTAGVIMFNGQEDLLTTIFYLVNSIQEHQSKNYDALGRFKFENSLQEKYATFDQSFVTSLFEKYFKQEFPLLLENRHIEKSRFFFSHDIDSLYGAFLQDGLAALKNGRFDIVARLITNAILQRPDWFNIDQIAKIDSDNDLRSTFFWIVNKGRVSEKTTNADYDITSGQIKKAIQSVQDKGLNIGLHKSLLTESYATEMGKMPVPVKYNRTHYLRFHLPQHYDQIEASGLEIDCSLGFAEQFGFRNSLAIPFVPYNLKTNSAYHFLEVPLNLMDGTFQKYMSVSSNTVFDTMLSFIENNSENAVISVLWHNHFFSSYRFRGFKEPYLALIEYIKQKEFTAIGPQELYNKYYFSD